MTLQPLSRATLPILTGVLFALLPPPAGADTPEENVAVITLKNAAGVEKGEAEVITDRLRTELFNTGRVNVMEREQMKDILREQGFQQSGACTDEACLVEMGRMLGVARLVTGSIGKLGSMVLLNLRVVDVETARIVKAVSKDIEGGIEGVVVHLSTVARALVSAEDEGSEAPEEPEPVREEAARDTVEEEEHDAVSTGEEEEQENGNRFGLGLAFVTFPGEATHYRQPEGQDDHEDRIDEQEPFRGGRITIAIPLGSFLALKVQPGFTGGWSEQYDTLPDTYGTADYKLLRLEKEIYIFGVDVGADFVWRRHPLRVNTGVLLGTKVCVMPWYTEEAWYTSGMETDSYSTEGVEPGGGVTFGIHGGAEYLLGSHLGFGLDLLLQYAYFPFSGVTLDEGQSYYDMAIQLPAAGLMFSVMVYF